MRIAILGTRGIPARYGGFESCVEEISTRLASRGHDVTVYCRSEFPNTAPREYEGVHLVQLPKLKNSFAATPFNSWLTTIHASLSGAEVIHYFGCGNVPFVLLSRLLRKKVVLTVDGIEWRRTSYSLPARLYLRAFAELAMVFPHETVADSKSSVNWYRGRTGMNPTHIPYGTYVSSQVDDEIKRKYGLDRKKYVLFAGRLVHEKGVHTLVEAFKHVTGDFTLVVIGDFPGRSNYVDHLKRTADDRTKFLGYVYGKDFETIRNGASIYVHPSMLDGTSIALLGAMGAGLCILSSDLEENADVAGDTAEYFAKGDVADLTHKLQMLLDSQERTRDLSTRARKRAKELHNWDMIADAYESIYAKISDRSR